MGRGTEEIRAALEAGELRSADPLRRRPDPRLPRHRRLGGRIGAADLVVAFSAFENATTPPWPTSSSRSRPTPRKTARSPTPTAACSGSGPAPRAPGEIRPNWQRARRALRSRWATTPALLPTLGLRRPDRGRSRSTPAITDSEIGGRGIRWQDHPSAASYPKRRDGTDRRCRSQRRASARLASATSERECGCSEAGLP